MPREKKSVQYQLLERLDVSKNNNTAKSQIRTVKDFAAWLKSQGVKDVTVIPPQELLQGYSHYLQTETKYTASTIHTKLAAPCKALGVSMKEIDKPKRTQSTLVRGRHDADRGAREQTQEKYERSVELSEALGLRRAELSRLKPEDLKMFAGHMCVHVIKGKGGKTTWQRVLLGHEADVQRIFADPRGQFGRVLDSKEFGPHIDYHSIRALGARKAYETYCNQAKTQSGRERLISELRTYYTDLHRNPQSVDKWLYRHLFSKDTVVRLRGENRERAASLGRPAEYDRLSLLCVSVFNLSHWRVDVTVTNYMLH